MPAQNAFDGFMKPVAPASKCATLPPSETRGFAMSNRFTQYILIAMALGIVMGTIVFNYLPDQRVEIAADVNLIAMLFLRLIKMIIAPLVFATLVGGIAHMGSGAGSAASSPRRWAGSSARPLSRCCSASSWSTCCSPAPTSPARFRGGPVDRPAGVGVLDREIPDPSDPDLDRGCDGAERDSADRGVRGVLRGGDGRDAGALQADAWR